MHKVILNSLDEPHRPLIYVWEKIFKRLNFILHYSTPPSGVFKVLQLVSKLGLWVELLTEQRKGNSWNDGRRISCEQTPHVQGRQLWLLEGKDDFLLWIYSHWYIGCCRKGQSTSLRCSKERDPQGQMDINLDFLSTHTQGTLWCALYHKKNISKFIRK